MAMHERRRACPGYARCTLCCMGSLAKEGH